jgi:Tfp pilus assembly protein PilF
MSFGPSTEEIVGSYSDTRPIGDVFAIQTEIANQIVEQLQIALAGEFPTVDETTPEVHSLYLQARQILETGQVENLDYARELLVEAIERDPDFFPARNWLAVAYFYLSRFSELDRAENLRLWASTMEQAALDWPDRPEVKVFRALQARENQDYATAAEYLERSLRHNPSSPEAWATAQKMNSAGTRMPSRLVSTCSCGIRFARRVIRH